MTVVGRARKRALVLFADAWDHRAQQSAAVSRSFCFEHAGFDLFRWPENMRLLGFDAERFLDRSEARCRKRGIDLVMSHHELWGALLAAELAERLGLPGHPPAAVLLAQHKLACRELLAEALPHATPRFGAVSYPLGDESLPELPFPALVKPIKATFSILARRVESRAELEAHLRFGPFEEFLLRRLVRPFEQLRQRRLPTSQPADGFLIEELAPGLLFNIDGYVAHGEVTVLGIVDSSHYPGTLAFERFELPSRLPPETGARAVQLAEAAVRALGLTHGCFNVELLYDQASDRLTLVEVNPRLAYQLADLYARVEGWDLYCLGLELAAGERPRLERRETPAAVAASFVYRRFDGRPQKPWPAGKTLATLGRQHPDALLMLYPRRGGALRREMRWLGSYRYAVLNLGARDHEELLHHERQIATTLGWVSPNIQSARDPEPHTNLSGWAHEDRV